MYLRAMNLSLNYLLCHLESQKVLDKSQTLLIIDCSEKKDHVINFDIKFAKNDYKYLFYDEFDNQTYDIVIILDSNNVFNQKKFYKKIHNICKENSIMLFVVTIQCAFNQYMINYHPEFYDSLSFFNSYDMIGKYISFDKEKDSMPMQFREHYISNLYLNENSLCNDNIQMYFVLKKLIDSKFIEPISLKIYNNMHNSNHKKKKLYKSFVDNKFKILFKNINKVAIFGTSEAGEMAYHLLKNYNVKIVCFVDDNKVGVFKNTNIEIVQRRDYYIKYEARVDSVVFGPNQSCKNNKFSNIVQIPFLVDINVFK